MTSNSDQVEIEPSAFVLASTSPRRLDLLRLAGVEPTLHAVEIDETPLAGETPAAMVGRLATEKARASWNRGLDQPNKIWTAGASPLLIAADTTVDLDGVSLGKPSDEAQAAEMLTALSGRTHQVFSGVAVMAEGRCETIIERTVVRFRALSEEDIGWYVSSGEPHGKAGSYTIQGLGSWMVEHMEGSYHNVVGLPVAALDTVTSSFGWPLRRLADRFPAVKA